MPYVVRFRDPLTGMSPGTSPPYATRDEAEYTVPIYSALGLVAPEVVFVKGSFRAKAHARRLHRRGRGGE